MDELWLTDLSDATPVMTNSGCWNPCSPPVPPSSRSLHHHLARKPRRPMPWDRCSRPSSCWAHRRRWRWCSGGQRPASRQDLRFLGLPQRRPVPQAAARPRRAGADGARLRQRRRNRTTRRCSSLTPLTVNTTHPHGEEQLTFADVDAVGSPRHPQPGDPRRARALRTSSRPRSPRRLRRPCRRIRAVSVPPRIRRQALQLRRPRRGWRGRAQGLPGHVRDGVVAKLQAAWRGARPRQVFEGGARDLLPVARSDFAEVGTRTPLRGHHRLRCARSKRQLAALIREPPARRRPSARKVSLRASSTDRRAGLYARLCVEKAIRRRQALGAESLDQRSPRASSRVLPATGERDRPQGAQPTGVTCIDKPGAVVDLIVCGRAPPHRARADARARLDPFRDGAPVLLRARRRSRSSSSDSTSARPKIDLRARTTTGDPKVTSSTSTRRPAGNGSSGNTTDLRGEIELRIPAGSAVKIDGERAYRLQRKGLEVEMPIQRSAGRALSS